MSADDEAQEIFALLAARIDDVAHEIVDVLLPVLAEHGGADLALRADDVTVAPDGRLTYIALDPVPAGLACAYVEHAAAVPAVTGILRELGVTATATWEDGADFGDGPVLWSGFWKFAVTAVTDPETER